MVTNGETPRRVRLAAVMIAVGMWMASGAAIAGDFYLRGGVGLDRPGGTTFMDEDCSTTTPAALYGCGTGGDGAPYRSRGDLGTVPALDLGLGYAAAAARFEVLVGYRPRFEFKGRANFLAPELRQSVSANLSSVSGMLAAFGDFSRLGLPTLGPLDPFIGVGVGAVRTHIGNTRMTFPATTTIAPGGSRTDMAWMATAGVALALNDRVTLDLAWRYTDLGEIRTARGDGRVVWRDGSREPLPLDLAPTRARLAGHGIHLSLRYAF
ncbi:MAG: hypothetical protein OXF11_05165 [Deltaproteobacteria bacterium]|nr:hypothetical protein [Deltaproteobacteria bacterium]